MPSRRRQVRKVVVERDSSDSESSDEGDDVEDCVDEIEHDEQEEKEEEEEDVEDGKKKKKKRITISLKAAKLCKVCKAKDHQAGFVGSIYLDCPNKPCYLCKRPGHTTATCPHRIATEHGVSPAPRRNTLGVIDFVCERQLRSRISLVKPKPKIPNRVECAIIKLHSRRVTCIDFHPFKDNILISGDKKGQIGIWDYEKVHDKTLYDTVHGCIVNSIKFNPSNDGTIYTCASDGTVCLTDIDTGCAQSVVNLNPDGWHGPSTWRMMYGMDLNAPRGLVLSTDNAGYLYQSDIRTNKQCGKALLIHKKGTKVVGLDCNPVEPDLFITCGNDHTARIWDMRHLQSSDDELAVLNHPRVVNSAYFSPITGNKIMSTCQDNRIRVWDCIFSDLTIPSREIVHSHDFNRYLTCFKAEWDPKDDRECLSVIGRYISDDFNGVALHPIDFIDVSSGQLVGEVVDSNITTITPVNKLHPRLDILASGSSRSLFIWRPNDDDDDDVDGDDGDVDGKEKHWFTVCNVVDDDGKKGKRKGKGKGKTSECEDVVIRKNKRGK